MVSTPGGRAPWRSWSSVSTSSSNCSWHSACTPQGLGGGPPVDQPNDDGVLGDGAVWASPGGPWWGSGPDSPWSLPPGWGNHSPVSSPVASLSRTARGRRPSVVAALLAPDLPLCHSAPRPVTAPPRPLDTSAFRRYYEDSVVGGGGGNVGVGVGVGNEGRCEGLGLGCLALARPTKLEGLVKLFAQSLHLVLAAMCSRSVCPSSCWFCFSKSFLQLCLRV